MGFSMTSSAAVSQANIAVAHRRVAERLGPRAALRFKRDGIYRDLSWNDYRRQADRAAAGLIELGIEPGDRVGILSENRWEWLVADIAILSAAAVGVPMHAPLTGLQVAYQLAHSGARGVIVSGPAQAAKVIESLPLLPELRWLIYFDPVDARAPIDVIPWASLSTSANTSAQTVRERETLANRADLATIIYTSGTTGNPKGVMLSHGNLLSNAEAVVATSGMIEADIGLTWLPLSHIYARTCDHYVNMCSGATLCLAESLETLVANIAETGPTHMSCVPRFYEKLWSSVERFERDERAARLGRLFGPRMRRLSSGGAPLPKHVARGFDESGMTLMEGYGLTESSPVISFNRDGGVRVGSVGRPIPGVEVKIAADGEILTKGPHVMMGYWKDPEATSLAIEAGWLHTGDVGAIDADGFLYVTDRKKDLIITSGGKNIAPSELERLLVSDPLIEQAVVYGDARPFVTALIVPNRAELERAAGELGCAVEVDGAFITTAPLVEFMMRRVDAVMRAVSQPERVKAILLHDRPFSVGADELTATLKVRRAHIIAKHQARLDELYRVTREDRFSST